MEKTLQVLLEEFWQTLKRTEKNIHRDYSFSEAKDLIKVAVGMRRSGKTCFLYQKIRELLSKAIEPERILYINFEDDRILPLDAKGMGQMIDAWYTLYPNNHNHLCYLFLDEVQNIESWALVLRRLQDTKNVQIYATGSSAKLLSKEIATSLRGRSIALEIFPYSYHEYLVAHSLPEPTKPFGKNALDHQKSYLLEYLRIGGFPGIQSLSQNDRLELLQNYAETVIFKDIVERHKVTNIVLLKYFIRFLLKNISAAFSINKFYNDIKSQGHRAGKDTLYDYLAYIEDAFLIFAVPLYTESLRKAQTTPKKIYGIDSGLVKANTMSFSDNFGRMFENLVYLDLKREGKKIFYYQTEDGYEVDFVTEDLQGRREIIQVTWDTQDKATLEREIRALECAKKELGFPGRLIEAKNYLDFR